MVAQALAKLGPVFHARGWVLGTSGNFSVVLAHRPLRLAITASSVDKSRLTRSQILEVDERARIVADEPKGARPLIRLSPSAETRLHIEIVRGRKAGAVLHTHSVWATLLSDVHADRGGVELAGYEMLKGLHGVQSHEHREWIPILANDQDMVRLAGEVRSVLVQQPHVHALLLRRHGLYTWGTSLADAIRHVEILEFLFETVGRTASFRRGEYHGASQDS